MENLDFAKVVARVVAEDPKFDKDAYFFVREALDFTVSQLGRNREVKSSHVTGQQLLEGIRLYAIKQFGPMVVTVFEYWGVRSCRDFGLIVYALIKAGVFRKSDTDSMKDFENGYSFESAFLDPYRPTSLPKARRRAERREVRNS